MLKLKEFESLAGFKIIRKQKTLTKNMNVQDQLGLINKTDFKVEKNGKYLGTVLTNMNCML